MAQQQVSMRKIKEILRLRYELGLRQDQIARSCNIGQATVHRYLERFAATDLQWPLPEGCDEAKLEGLLFATRRGRPAGSMRDRPAPDFTALHSELQSHKHLTLQLLWEEYRAREPGGYGYSRFCELYNAWKEKLDVVLRQEHRPGEKLFVDWAGSTVPLYHREVGEIDAASLFVAVMGASNYTFIHATRNQDLWNWIDCHVRAFAFYGRSMPILVIPDNPKDRRGSSLPYEPDLNRTYDEMADIMALRSCRRVPKN